MFGSIGPWEMIGIFLIALLLFGAKRLPEIGRSLGKGIREFKSSVREIEGEINRAGEIPPADRSAPEPQDRPSSQEQGEPHRLTTDDQ